MGQRLRLRGVGATQMLLVSRSNHALVLQHRADLPITETVVVWQQLRMVRVQRIGAHDKKTSQNQYSRERLAAHVEQGQQRVVMRVEELTVRNQAQGV